MGLALDVMRAATLFTETMFVMVIRIFVEASTSTDCLPALSQYDYMRVTILFLVDR